MSPTMGQHLQHCYTSVQRLEVCHAACTSVELLHVCHTTCMSVIFWTYAKLPERLTS